MAEEQDGGSENKDSGSTDDGQKGAAEATYRDRVHPANGERGPRSGAGDRASYRRWRADEPWHALCVGVG